MAIKPIKKISIKTVFGDKGAILDTIMKDKAVDHKIVRIFGMTGSTKTGESDYGPFVAFRGRFKAINLVSGEEFTSSMCYLPELASDMVQGALETAGDANIEFAFDVGVQYDAQSATSYIYTVNPLLEPSNADPLSAFEKHITNKNPLPVMLEHKPEAEKKPEVEPKK
jgi:hypothetical protein